MARPDTRPPTNLAAGPAAAAPRCRSAERRAEPPGRLRLWRIPARIRRIRLLLGRGPRGPRPWDRAKALRIPFRANCGRGSVVVSPAAIHHLGEPPAVRSRAVGGTDARLRPRRRPLGAWARNAHAELHARRRPTGAAARLRPALGSAGNRL